MALSAGERRASATISPSKGYPSGRFPLPDVKHARLALQMLPRAKNMSSSEKAEVRSKAQQMLGGSRKAAAQKASSY